MITTAKERWQNERDLMFKSLDTLERILRQDTKEIMRLVKRIRLHIENEPKWDHVDFAQDQTERQT